MHLPLPEPADPIRAIVNAARHIAQQKLDEAASGKLSRLDAFCAVMALEAAYAYLKLWGPKPVGPPPPHIHIAQERAVMCNAEGSAAHTRSPHGGN